MKAKNKRSKDGSIYQLPNKKWRCMISIGQKENGSRNRISKIFDTEIEAKNWRLRQLTTIREYGNESVKSTNELFAVKYYRWLLDIKQVEVCSLSFNRMIRDYNKHIKPNFQKSKQMDLTKEDFQNFFKKLEQENIGLETRRKIKCILHQYFERELVNTPMRNPLDGIKIFSKKKEVIIDPKDIIFCDDYKAVPKEMRRQFLNALDNDSRNPFLKPLCYLMYYTGNRIGEALAYQWKDYNFDRRYFLVYKAVTMEYNFDESGNKIGNGKTIVKSPKTSKGIRPLPILDILYEVLMEWYDFRKSQEKLTNISFTAPDDYLFATDKGVLRSRSGTNVIFYRFLKRNNLENRGIHFHALRQTFSNALFAEELDDKLITDLLGHKKISTSKEHYNSIQKFDSVQKAAYIFNSKFKPKNPKHCASENITFSPDGYLAEQESYLNIDKKSGHLKRPILKLIEEVLSCPEFLEIFEKLLKTQIKI